MEAIANETMNTHKNSKNPKCYQGHILIVCSPLQGHASPLMKLSHQITKYGTKVTFLSVNSTCARTAESEDWNHGIHIVAMPDGLELADHKKDKKKVFESLDKVLPVFLEDLLKKNSKSPKISDRISGAIIDMPLAMVIEIPKKMGIKTATFWCSSPGCLVLGFHIPHLLQAQLIDPDDGTSLKSDKIKLLPNMPDMSMTELIWYTPSDINKQKLIFQVTKSVFHHIQNADWILCNWFHELDPAPSTLLPNLLSVGPLLADGPHTGSLFPEDRSCMTWLDKQSDDTVVYVAFGSSPRFSNEQLGELADGLERMGRLFLFVAWSGLRDEPVPLLAEEFVERVGDRGKIVEWAPQEAVLGHRAVSCFVTHCGWNSFLESVSNGVPLICWPYFGDQMYTEKCACDAWKIGVSLKRDENGIVLRDEIVERVEEIFCNRVIRNNALRLKGMARKSIDKGGSSLINLEYIVQQMKF